MDENGATLVSEYITALEKGESYGIASPDVEGYTPDIEKIEGTMEDKDLSFTVTYTKIADTEDYVESGPDYATPDTMGVETETETETEKVEESTEAEGTVGTIVHQLTETNVKYNYELLVKIILIDTLIFLPLAILTIKWKRVKVLLASVKNKRKKK